MLDPHDIKNFHQACNNVLDNSKEKALNWCVKYAQFGLSLVNYEDAKAQAPYILGNMTHWRGPIASETRSLLKNFIK